MRLKEEYFPEARFGGFTDIDGTIAFYNRVNALLSPDDVLLDFGCGRGSYVDDDVPLRKNLRIFNHKCKHVVGVDVDPDAEGNPFIDEFRLIQNTPYPLDDNSIDLCVCDWVVEHLPDPRSFFLEMRRIIKNNGYLCIRTVNKFHYVPLFSRLIPNTYHQNIVHRLQAGRKEEDVFPTVYTCNTLRDVKNEFKKISQNFYVYSYEAEPSYLEFSRVPYSFGCLYRKLAPANFRHTIFAFCQIFKD